MIVQYDSGYVAERPESCGVTDGRMSANVRVVSIVLSYLKVY